jgi:hypothetical protein
MKKKYFLIGGILFLLLAGWYFIVDKFSGNNNIVTIENENLITDSSKGEIENTFELISNEKLILNDSKLKATPIWYKDGENLIAYDNGENSINIYKVDISDNQKQQLLISLNEKKLVSLMLDNDILNLKYYDTVDKKIKYSYVLNKDLVEVKSPTKDFKSKFFKSFYGPTETDQISDIEVGMIKEDNGYNTTKSDLYIKDLSSKEHINITNSPNVIELFPFFHPDGNRIIYWIENQKEHKMEPYIITFKN